MEVRRAVQARSQRLYSDKKQWQETQAEYLKHSHTTGLQEQLGFVDNGKKMFISPNVLIINIKTIAGAGGKTSNGYG